MQEYREFLGGFRKRKLERKRKAQEHLEQQLKEERKKIKKEVSYAVVLRCQDVSRRIKESTITDVLLFFSGARTS